MRLNELVKKEQDRDIQRSLQQKLEKKLNKASDWSANNNNNNTLITHNDNDQQIMSTQTTNSINKSQSAHNLNSSTIHKFNKYVLIPIKH